MPRPRVKHFTVDIPLVNAAFDPDPTDELVSILRDMADRVDAGDTYGKVFDCNGNTIGTWFIG